jgi:L-cysteine S-thiosulfotransferase
VLKPVAAAMLAALVAAPASAQTKDAPLLLDGTAAQQPWTRYADWPKGSFKFSTLAEEKAPPAPTEPRKFDAPITGDSAKGQRLAFDRSRGGSCVACHVMGSKTPEMPGNVGPDLSEEGKAGRDDEFLFNYVYDARVYNPETVMPPWGLHRIFNDDEIKDIVAFLKSLKEPAKLADDLQYPEKRPAPKEDRDNLDAMLNPAMWAVDKAQDLWAVAGEAGKSCRSCHEDPASAFKSWGAHMPKWEPRLKRVLGIEEFVYRHGAATTGAKWLMQSDENLAMSVYLRGLANEEPIQVEISAPEAKQAAERGKALMSRKVGELNFACTDCHAAGKGADHWIRGQWLAEVRGQLDHFPTWRTSRQEIWDIRKRFEWCNVAIRAQELPPDAPEYGDIELYLTSLSNGLKLSVPGIRH